MNLKMQKPIYLLSGIGAILIIAGAVIFLKSEVNKPNVNIDPRTLPGIQTGNAPWPPEITSLKTRLLKIGLPALTQEGTALHIHQHMDIIIDNQIMPVPAGVGINEGTAFGYMAPIHVHDNTGIIHVESPTAQNFYLGQFFDIWGVLFTNNCIGGYCNQGDKTLKVFVNGSLYDRDPRNIQLQSHQEIEIIYGTQSEIPNPILSSFPFPQGY